MCVLSICANVHIIAYVCMMYMFDCLVIMDRERCVCVCPYVQKRNAYAAYILNYSLYFHMFFFHVEMFCMHVHFVSIFLTKSDIMKRQPTGWAQR